jgi:hypothetical protein
MNIHYDINSETGLMNLKFKKTILDPLGDNKDIFEKYILPMLSMNEKFVLTGSLSLKLLGFEPMDKVGDFDFGLLDTFTEEEYVSLKNFFGLHDTAHGYGREQFPQDITPKPEFYPKAHMWQFSKRWSEPVDADLAKELFFKMDIFNDEMLRKKDIITIYYEDFPVRLVHPSITLSYRMRYALDVRSSTTFKYWEKMKAFMDNAKSYYNQIVDDLKLQNNNLIVCFQQIVSQAIDKPDIKISQGKDVNNQLIDIIVNKTKTIEDLKDKAKQKNDKMIILNDVCISFRQTDNYINATQLCKAGNKIFDEWVCLETTIQLINELEDVTSLQLIENDKTYYWVHPDIALQLANWISVSFYSDLCKWFRMNNTILISKDKELKIKDEKIHLLENLRVKKQKRSNYPNNVVYIIMWSINIIIYIIT